MRFAQVEFCSRFLTVMLSRCSISNWVTARYSEGSIFWRFVIPKVW